MPKDIRIAVAQISPRLGDLEANIGLHREWIARARKEGAKLIVFPELSLTGYDLRDLVPDIAIEPAEAKALEPLLEESREIAVCLGFVEVNADHMFFNSAAYLEGGKVRHVHRKAYLPTYRMFDEKRYFAEGKSFRAFDAEVGRLGILICEDFWHIPPAYLLALDGARLHIIMSASPVKTMRPGEEESSEDGLASQSVWQEMARTTSRLYTVYTLFANLCGSEDKLLYGGRSFLADPSGEIVAAADAVEEELLIVSINERELRRARTRWPLLRDERPEMVLRELERLLREDRSGLPGEGESE
jgi:predicted amidohydrolase